MSSFADVCIFILLSKGHFESNIDDSLCFKIHIYATWTSIQWWSNRYIWNEINSNECMKIVWCLNSKFKMHVSCLRKFAYLLSTCLLLHVVFFSLMYQRSEEGQNYMELAVLDNARMYDSLTVNRRIPGSMIIYTIGVLFESAYFVTYYWMAKFDWNNVQEIELVLHWLTDTFFLFRILRRWHLLFPCP